MQEEQGGQCHPSKVSGTGESSAIESHSLMHGQDRALADSPLRNNRPSAVVLAWLSSHTHRCLVAPADTSRAAAGSLSNSGDNSPSKASTRTDSVGATRANRPGCFP